MGYNHFHRQRLAMVVIVSVHNALDGKTQKNLPKKLIEQLFDYWAAPRPSGPAATSGLLANH